MIGYDRTTAKIHKGTVGDQAGRAKIALEAIAQRVTDATDVRDAITEAQHAVDRARELAYTTIDRRTR